MWELVNEVVTGGPGALARAVLEVVVLSYLVYQLILVLRGTRATPIVLGLALLGGVYYVSGAVGLEMVHRLIGSLAPYTIIALIVIFQPEIRRALRQFALQFLPSGRRKKAFHEYEDVVLAVGHLSQRQVGALIVLQRETGLRTFVQSGVALDAHLSTDLLESVFDRGSPLHDGAVIIRRGRIAAAACFLPLTTNPGQISSLGTRHRAAIGVSEEGDCLAIAVSEADGQISVASAGSIERDVTLDRLRVRLIESFGPVVSPPRGTEATQLPVRKTAPAVAYAETSSRAGSAETR